MRRRGQPIGARARRVKMVLLDVDGVLTDGGLYYTADGHELKRFHAHDGYGIVRGRDAGLAFGIISGRSTPIVDARARVLKIDEVIQGAEDKVAAMRQIQRRTGLADDEFAFIGDDLFDIPLLKLVGLSAAPPNALREVRAAVHYVTRVGGGEGAVRDFVDTILSHRRA
ncbi:MAG TPA: HAD-IIIA family hydrolase [Bacteroidota bacterium]|nr:HAD-IIIA family hydrolase [Bacteroidota bacterium]